MHVDGKLILAGVISCGLIVLIGIAQFASIPESSQRVVDTGIGGLLVILGNQIQGLYRTDKTDETRAGNTATALETIGKAIDASPGGIDARPA